MAEREGAVIRYGEEALVKAREALEEVGLPAGLLPLEDVIESGVVEETGYVWITQKKEIRHLFKIAGRQVSYGREIKGFLEKNRMRSLTGVKAKELFLWAPIGDISINPSLPEKIAFKSFGGIAKSFPVEAFAIGQ